MRKLLNFAFAAAVLLGAVTVAPRPAFGQPQYFSDLGNHWAAGPIYKMSLKGVIKGYDDGTFKPNDPVRRVEAVTMLVRSLGLEEQAKGATVLPAEFSDQKSIDQWARGYISAGVSSGIIAGEDLKSFRPRDNTLRYEAAILLVRALGLEAEAERRQGAAVNFNDLLSIPRAARGYVAVAAEKGLMNGTDGFFRPDKPITRAEMATILARMDRLISNSLDSNEVKGTITRVNAEAPYSLRLKDSSGTETTLPISWGVRVYRQGSQIPLRDLLVTDESTVLKDGSGQAVFIEAEPAPIKSFKGSVTNLITAALARITIKTSEGEQTYPVESSVAVKRNDESANLEDILTGDEATLYVQGDTVIRIEARTVSRTVRGFVKSITIAAQPVLVVTTTGQKEEVFRVASGATLQKKGSPTDLRTINIGDYVEIEARSSEAFRINIEAKEVFEELAGVVTSIDRSASTINIAVTGERFAPEDADRRAVKVSTFTLFIKHASESNFTSLAVGDRVLSVGRIGAGEFIANTIVVTFTAEP